MTRNPFVPVVLALALAAPALAQAPDYGALALGATAASPEPPAEDDSASAPPAAASLAPTIAIQHVRPADQRGLNVFEAPKKDAVPFTGFRLDFGAAFAQQFQGLEHSNAAAPRLLKDATGSEYDANELLDIGLGFNLATANLNVNAQLAPGIRVALESYMSSRHHNEFWVKGGYLQIDRSPIDLPILHEVMEYVTLKAGMFELNYGDAHFRRSDNGNVIHNPFVENYLLDAFNTEIGTEVYVRTGPWMAMLGVTDGVNKGGVNLPSQRGPAFLGKVGYDRQVTPSVRVRLTGSAYDVDRTPSSNLYGGDRTGSRYYSVLENTRSTLTGNFTSGRLNPGFTNQLRALQLNPFVKIGGLELFGVLEQAEGKHSAEPGTRTWTQYAGDVVYRFLAGEKLYVGARHNTASGRLRNLAEEVGADRTALAAGWFITPTVLVKGEYVTQKYNGFVASDIRSGGKFDGFVVEGAIAF